MFELFAVLAFGPSLVLGLAGLFYAVVLVVRVPKRARVLPWIPTALHAVDPPPGPLIRYLASANDLSMAVREAWNASQGRRWVHAGLAHTLDRTELAALCGELEANAAALRTYLAPYDGLYDRLGVHVEVLAGVWSSTHEMRPPGQDWRAVHPALGRVTRAEGVQSRHRWTLDAAAAVSALTQMIALCDPDALPVELSRDYRVDYDKIEPGERALIERIWTDEDRPHVNHWLDSTDIDERVLLQSEMVGRVRVECRALLEVLEGHDGEVVLVVDGLDVAAPVAVDQTQGLVDLLADPAPWGLEPVYRRIQLANGIARKLDSWLTREDVTDDRFVVGAALSIHRCVFPRAEERFVGVYPWRSRVSIVVCTALGVWGLLLAAAAALVLLW